jgi:hypothetical protein
LFIFAVSPKGYKISVPLGCCAADYLAKKGTKMSQTSACKQTFHSAKLKVKRNIQADLSGYYAIQRRRKSWDKIVTNGNIISDFPREDAVADFFLITAHDCLAHHLHILSVYPIPICFTH